MLSSHSASGRGAISGPLKAARHSLFRTEATLFEHEKNGRGDDRVRKHASNGKLQLNPVIYSSLLVLVPGAVLVMNTLIRSPRMFVTAVAICSSLLALDCRSFSTIPATFYYKQICKPRCFAVITCARAKLTLCFKVEAEFRTMRSHSVHIQ